MRMKSIVWTPRCKWAPQNWNIDVRLYVLDQLFCIDFVGSDIDNMNNLVVDFQKALYALIDKKYKEFYQLEKIV